MSIDRGYKATSPQDLVAVESERIISIDRGQGAVAPPTLASSLTVKGVVESLAVPSGGAMNMILTKASNDNYDTKWTDVVEGVDMNGGYF